MGQCLLLNPKLNLQADAARIVTVVHFRGPQAVTSWIARLDSVRRESTNHYMCYREIELKDNTVVIVMGASGDLAKKKTFPALFGLFRNRFLPKNVHIVGYARTKMDHEEYLKRVKSNIKTPTKDMEEQLVEFCKTCSYVSGQYDKDESFQELEKALQEIEKGQKETNRVFYMALPPSVFIPVSEHVKKNCYPQNGIARLIVRDHHAV